MQNEPGNRDEALSKVLKGWHIDAPLPPRFQEHVWQRIALAEAETTRNWWQVLIRSVESVFVRPALAVSYVAVLLFVGLAAGYRHADQKTARAESQWRTLYVQSVDPYQMPRNQE